MSLARRGIKSWPVMERPRERLLERGPHVLSDAELLAVLFRQGHREQDAVSWARDILSRFGGLKGLLAAGPKVLFLLPGMGAAKIASLMAAHEIIRRQLREQIIGQNYFSDPESVLNFLSLSLEHKKREIFKVLFLDKGNRLIDEVDLFQGTLDGAAIYPREILKAALDRHAAALILVHNHPSGRMDPSPEDRRITRQIQEACQKVDIKILDHLIVGEGRYFSFCEHGLLPD